MLQFFQNILAALDTMLLYPSLVREVSTSPRMTFHDVLKPNQRNLESLGQEVAELFTAPINPRRMSRMSARLQRRYLEKLQSSAECMLPSFNYTLPTGQETGTYLALDVGGSTLRVALVELGGKAKGAEGLKITKMSVSPIDSVVRKLPGTSFFDWMAGKIADTLAECPEHNGRDTEPLPVGLSWSFPVEQTSSYGGKVQGMGKGFCCAQATIGQDLGELIVAACHLRGLNLRIDALVNDSCATLLSRAYLEPSTTMSIILGTGTNMAVHLPVSCLGGSKLRDRDESWLSLAEKVTINTEVSMFGKGILPETRWDNLLNRSHTMPDFQPLEYMTTGRYLGEILRLIIAEAADTTDLFDGNFPSVLEEPYSLDTSLLAIIEGDSSANLSRSGAYLEKAWGLDVTPTAVEMAFLRMVVESISRRAACYLAVVIHALWAVEKDGSGVSESSRTTIACNGSVIEKYPGFRQRCQGYVAEILSSGGEEGLQHEVLLEMADEAAILGAAVAVAIGNRDR
jgi:hexokinase